MIYYLYEIRNNLNNKIYIGVHKTKDINDGYMGSGKVIKRAIEKYGVENFTKTILEEFSTVEEMFAKEKEIINEEFLLREDVYNLKCGGFGGFDYINDSGIDKFKGKKHKEESKRRIGEASLGREISEETRQKLSDNNWSRSNPEEQKQHASRIAKERHLNGKTEEERSKIALTVSKRHKEGRYSYEHLIGLSKNKGKRWIHRGKEQRMISKDLPLPEGWSEKRK